MDPRTKDAIRETTTALITIQEGVEKLLRDMDKMKKDFKSIKRAFVRKYSKDNG